MGDQIMSTWKYEHGSVLKPQSLFALTAALWNKKKNDINFDIFKGGNVCELRKPARGIWEL